MECDERLGWRHHSIASLSDRDGYEDTAD